jgi:hypothetical protein
MYHHHGATLSRAQIMKLAQGVAITLKKEHVHGPHPLWLTKVQKNKLESAKRKGVGARIQFSTPQIQHNILHGGSLWDLAKKGIGAVASVASHLPAVVDTAKSTYSGYKNAGLLGAAGGAAQGIGKAIAGNGIFGSIGSIVDGIGGFGLPKKGSAEMKARMAALRARRGHKTAGNGLLAPGS